MRFNLGYVFIITIFWATPIHATSPCFPPTQDWFVENVIRASDLVVYAKIHEFSDHVVNGGEKWTEVIVSKVLYGENLQGEKIKIIGWQAKERPFFIYEKGRDLLLWLKRAEWDYQLVNRKWKYCVPAIWTSYEYNSEKISNPLLNEIWSLEKVREFINISTIEAK